MIGDRDREKGERDIASYYSRKQGKSKREIERLMGGCDERSDRQGQDVFILAHRGVPQANTLHFLYFQLHCGEHV